MVINSANYCESPTSIAEVEKIESWGGYVFEDKGFIHFREVLPDTENGIPHTKTDR